MYCYYITSLKFISREKCKESTIIKKYVMILKYIRCEMSSHLVARIRGILELKNRNMKRMEQKPKYFASFAKKKG